MTKNPSHILLVVFQATRAIAPELLAQPLQSLGEGKGKQKNGVLCRREAGQFGQASNGLGVLYVSFLGHSHIAKISSGIWNAICWGHILRGNEEGAGETATPLVPCHQKRGMESHELLRIVRVAHSWNVAFPLKGCSIS